MIIFHLHILLDASYVGVCSFLDMQRLMRRSGSSAVVASAVILCCMSRPDESGQMSACNRNISSQDQDSRQISDFIQKVAMFENPKIIRHSRTNRRT